MNYNSFTQRNKLTKAELNNQIQLNKISLREWTASQIEARVENTQPRGQNIALSNSWDSEWEIMDATVSSGITYDVYKSWVINFGEMNYNWLNKFQIEIICRNGVDGDGDSSGFQVQYNNLFRKFIGWNIKDLENNPSSDTKNIQLLVSLYSYRIYPYVTSALPIFESKLLVKYLDQSNRD
jgi:hypothetical protein